MIAENRQEGLLIVGTMSNLLLQSQYDNALCLEC
jgi:hypothetical protein